MEPLRKNVSACRRKPKPDQFYASIFEYFLFQKELSPCAKILLVALHAKSFRNKDLLSGKCQATVSQQALADELGFSRKSIQNWLSELVKAKAIHVTCRKRSRERNIYSLLLPPKEAQVQSPSDEPEGAEIQAKNENIPEGNQII
jgi:hypothetical protein